MRIPAFEWDEWNVEHIAEHGISPEEAEEVCSRRPWILKSRQGRYFLMGQTEAGRYLAVVIVVRPGNAAYVITARPMNQAERRRYEKRQR